MSFMLLSIFASLLVLLFLLRPLFLNQTVKENVERESINVDTIAARLSDLNLEFEAGQIEQQEYEQQKLDLEMSVAEDLRSGSSSLSESRKGNRLLSILIMLSLPVSSILIYQNIGTPEAFLFPDSAIQNSTQQMEKMLSDFETEIMNNPEDIQGRIALAQVYIELQRYEDAATLYEELNVLMPNDPDILANYADALGRTQGNRLHGKPKELLQQSLTIKPNHERSLWLAGFAEIQSGNKKQALVHWHNLLAGLEQGSDVFEQVKKLIGEVESGESETGATVDSDNAESSISVVVSIADEFKSEIDPESSLFIFARAEDGPSMPLAVYRGLAKDLPLSVTLDDSMAMMPEMSLSNYPRVIVTARVSGSGVPQGKSGDLEGFSEVIEHGENSSVEIVIDQIKP